MFVGPVSGTSESGRCLSCLSVIIEIAAHEWISKTFVLVRED
jgi:hypothetical protein